MLKLVKSSLAAAALIGFGFGLGLVTPAAAQTASEMAVRMQQLEEQVRQLTGQVEELSFQVKQMRALGAAAQPQQSGAAQPVTPPAPIAVQQGELPQPSQQKRLAAASAGAPIPDSNGIETVVQQPIATAPLPAPVQDASQPYGAMTDTNSASAPGPQILGAIGTAAARPDDGGFQGKVLVPPSQQDAGDAPYGQQAPGVAAPAPLGNESIETVSLGPDATGETPESLYERSNESLLRRQFGDAEAGFSNFLQRYPDHSLAGSAQYWLGETYFAQNDFKRAAANFLQGYKKYPSSRRAPDSLLKLGISLSRLGQGEQACAAYAAVSTEYPKAVDARKRAQSEAKRAGCAS